MPAKFSKDDVNAFVGAAMRPDLEVLSKALSAGMPVDAISTDKTTALYSACAQGKTDAAKLLLAHGANPNLVVHASASSWKHYQGVFTPLGQAIRVADRDMIDELLAHGANPSIIGRGKNTAAHEFIGQFKEFGGSPERERYLESTLAKMLDAGLDINQRGDKGEAILHCAIDMHAPLSTCRMLLDRGAEVTQLTGYGETPLHRAARAGRPDLVQMLVEHGADVNAIDSIGATALFYFRGTDTGQLLLELGAKINIRDIFGNTALGSRVSYTPKIADAGEAIQVLLAAGADPDEQNYEGLYTGLTARDVARNRNLTEVAALLDGEVARRAVVASTRPAAGAAAIHPG